MAAVENALSNLKPDRAAAFAWMHKSPAAPVMAVLEEAAPGCARFVGGCVRDSLAGVPPKDIDIATTLRPDEVLTILQDAGVNAIPTGIDHGTITGVVDHQPVEITTLRADVSTDGRRATVAFTDDWRQDAERRDFTINALYLTSDLRLFDPVGGAQDLEDKRVRFIGDAHMRIGEDYLRILRFFRFSARFAETLDADGLEACAALKDGIATLSAERVGDELCKILALHDPADVVQAMQESGVLAMVWNETPEIDALRRLKHFDPTAPAPLGLAALYGEDDQTADGVTIERALRLSNVDRSRRRAAIANASLASEATDEKTARAALYRLGADRWRDAVAVAASLSASDKSGSLWRSLVTLPDRWTPPSFPIGGNDVLAMGVKKGPDVASILTAVEDQWIGEHFPDEKRARAILAARVSAHLSS